MNSNTVKKIAVKDWLKLPEAFRATIGGLPHVLSKDSFVPVEILY